MAENDILLSVTFPDAQTFKAVFSEVNKLKVSFIDLIFTKAGLTVSFSVPIGVGQTEYAHVTLVFRAEKLIYKYNYSEPEYWFTTSVANLVNGVSLVKAVDHLTFTIHKGIPEIYINRSTTNSDPSAASVSSITFSSPENWVRRKYNHPELPYCFNLTCSSIITASNTSTKAKASDITMKLTEKGIKIEGIKNDHTAANCLISEEFEDEEASIEDFAGLSLVNSNFMQKKINSKAFDSIFSLVTLCKKGVTRFYYKAGGYAKIVGDIGTMGETVITVT